MNSEKVVLCHCMDVSKATVQKAIDSGVSTFPELVDKTKASTGCGSCALYLHEMLGEKPQWTAVRAKKQYSIAHDIKSFRMVAVDKTYQFPKHQSGHHILVKAKIKGQWVTRPYAISSMRSASGYREIVVKRKQGGEFTEWLFRQKSVIDFYISDPQGDKFFNVEDKSRPVICFAGGVGITPVISACRSIYAEKIKQTDFHIDYSTIGHTHVSKQAKKEFNKIFTENKGFSVNLRDTEIEGKICFKDIEKIVKESRLYTLYYISGPVQYELHVQRCLLKAGVKSHSIYPLTTKNLIEKSALTTQKKQYTFEPYFYIGVFLFLSFIIQDGAKLKIPALETLQLQEYYKRWTGYGLLAYFCFQWSYPLVRMLKENQYFMGYQKIHKLTGAFAPAMFYIHSTTFGYAYLLVLSIGYLLNFLLPLCNKDNFQTLFNNQMVYRTWLGSHVFLSVLVTSLMFYHMFNAFAYS